MNLHGYKTKRFSSCSLRWFDRPMNLYGRKNERKLKEEKIWNIQQLQENML